MQQLRPVSHGQRFVRSRGSSRRLFQDLFDPVDVQGAALIAVLEPVQNLFGFGDLSRLKIKNSQGGIAAGPFRQHLHGTLKLRSGFGGVSFEC